MRSLFPIVLLAACQQGGIEIVTPPTSGTDTPPVADTVDTGPDPTPTTPVVEPHNVLVLLTDDQGTDKVGVYGEHPEPPPTPRIDALADEGVLFRNAWATPICSPTRAALLTGRTGRRTGMGAVAQYLSGTELPTHEVIIPELLKHADPPYANAALGKWHIAAYNADSGVDHPNLLGFDHFAGSMANLYDFVEDDGLRHTYLHWEKIVDGEITKSDTYATTDTVDDALTQMETLPEPWFLYVAFNAPHRPLTAPPEHLTDIELTPLSPDIERYPAVVQALDTEIGRLLDTMDPAVRERTTIVFMADNGTPDHAVLEPWSPDRAKDTPFEGGINVPMIVTGPLVEQPGTETAALVHVVDILPTVAEIAGVELSGPDAPTEIADVALDGHSLVPILRDPTATVREVVHAEKFSRNGRPPYRADWRLSRDDRFKVMWTDNPVMPLVFDLQGRVDDGLPIDPGVLSTAEQAQVDALLTAHDAYWDGIPPLEEP